MRQPPEDIPLFSGEGLEVGPKVVLTVGTDAAVGKMTATLEIQRAAEEVGISTEFAATGQTGIIIAGWGISVDAVVSDFVAGAAEQLVLRAAESSPDLILVEGQGSLGHPAYSGVTLSLLHGSCPDCLILCADASEENILGLTPRPEPARAVRLYEEVAALVKPAPVVAISLNTKGLDDKEAEEFASKDLRRDRAAGGGPVQGLDVLYTGGRSRGAQDPGYRVLESADPSDLSFLPLFTNILRWQASGYVRLFVWHDA